MKPPKLVRLTAHAESMLADRNIERADVEETIGVYEFRVPDALPPREVLMRRCFDGHLARKALLRVVVEETPLEIVIITVYKTTRIARYLRGLEE